MSDVLNLLQLVEQLQQDLRSVVNETKKKFNAIKDNAEIQMKKLKELVNGKQNIRDYISENNVELITPFIDGCSTKQLKLVSICLTALQRMITNKILNEKSTDILVKTLSLLTESEVEELKVLQTTILLVTASPTAVDEALAQALGICFRLHAGKTSAIVNTAAAAIRQCTSAVFDRISRKNIEVSPPEKLSTNFDPKDFDFTVSTKAAFYLFQDLCLLTAGDAPHWFSNIQWISKLLGLELIESVLINYSYLFTDRVEFRYLLKERVCPLVIKILVPVLPLDTQRSGTLYNDANSFANNQAAPSDFSINVRLNRIIFLLCSTYFECLNTECEVFLSTTMRMVDNEQNPCRKAIAMEVLFKIISQPDLLKKICTKFDFLEPPSRLFQELVNTMSNYVQAVLRNQMQPSLSQPISGSSNAVGRQGLGTVKPAFIYRGSQFVITDTQKCSLLEMLERNDQPVLPEGYCLRMGISCLLQFVWSLQHIVVQTTPLPNADQDERHLVELACCGLLPAFSVLLEACAEDKLTESLLLAQTVLVELCSKCGLDDGRDAFVAAICKAALPSNFSLTILSSANKASPKHQTHESSSQGMTDEALERSPVVVVVNAMHSPGSSGVDPSSASSETINSTNDSYISGGGQSAPSSLFITAKNIQVFRALLELAKANGNLLNSSWYLVLNTLQQLVWMLGLKAAPTQDLLLRPSVNGNLVTGANSGDVTSMNLNTSAFESTGGPSAVNLTSNTPASQNLTSSSTASSASVVSKVIAELPTLSVTLSAIFEQSRSFDKTALEYLVNALCKLATETREIATTNKDPSHFSVAKLTEVGLANMHRLDSWWKAINDELLQMCKSLHLNLRKLSVDAVILLVKQAIIAQRSPSFWQGETLTSIVLEPLSRLTSASYNDVQEKQLECVQYLLQCYGDEINGSWLRLITIIGAISQSQSDQLIKTAFQCFQLVITDYLSTLRPDCYPACVETAAKYGHQDHDLNISLAAIGSLLTLADFLFQRERSSDDDTAAFEQLWVSVFCHLSNLCRDRRPAVRKSAGQTLFNTIECHSNQFVQTTWFQLLWTVFFPLLFEVQNHCANAPVERAEGKQSNLLVHHSRDTAAKQWAETVVLALSGVARCFVSKRSQLIGLDRFPEAWDELLSNAERAVLTPNSEIAHNALLTLRILLDFDTQSPAQSTPVPADLSCKIWLSFWRVWLSIGNKFVSTFGVSSEVPNTTSKDEHPSSLPTRQTTTYAFDGGFFALYFDLFPALFPHIQEKFDGDFFSDFAKIVQQGVLGPLFAYNGLPSPNISNASSYLTYFPGYSSSSSISALQDDTGMTCTQRAVFTCLTLFSEIIQKETSFVRPLLVPFIELLLHLSSYAVRIPRPGSVAGQVEAIPLSYIIFSEKCMDLATAVYKRFAESELVYSGNVMQKMIEALRVPLATKYKCQCQSTWLLASRCFIDVLKIGFLLPNSKKLSDPRNSNLLSSVDVWDAILATLRGFLFCQNLPNESLSGEELQQHEALDCKFITLICDLFLTHPEGLPSSFIEQLVDLLGLGSVQASINSKDFAGLSLISLNPSETNESDGTVDEPLPSVHVSSYSLVDKGDIMSSASSLTNTIPSLSEGLGTGDIRPFNSREVFMKLCFESLLSFAFTPFVEGKSSTSQSGVLCRAAVQNVLNRCQFILQRFSRSAQLTGRCPLPRAKLSEVNFAFQAMASLLTKFTTASHGNIDDATWQSVIDLYPLVVDCVFVAESTRLLPGLHHLLHLYGCLLQPK